tara:strand:- start:392 stop:853 length:462 start_codon:yes stop_codon:yes gene_type:complete
MGIKIDQRKNAIRKKNNIVEIGSDSQDVTINGSLYVEGAFVVNNPVGSPVFSPCETIKMFSVSPQGLGWTTYSPKSIILIDVSSGVDECFVQTTRGFTEESKWCLNPGGNNMESGIVKFKLDSRLFISGSGINSGLYFDHKKGERLISIDCIT